MPLSHAFTSTGPPEALAAAARRLSIRASRDALVARFDRHPAPQSLKALLEIAPELGLTAQGFRSDLAGLADVRFPAIVHLVDPGTGNAGFGVLTGRREGRFLVEEAHGAAPSELTGEEFLSVWSGVVITLAPRAGAVPSPELTRTGPLARIRFWYGGDDPLSRATLAARFLALCALAVLCLATCAGIGRAVASPWVGGAAAAACALAACGAAVSAALFFQSRRSVVPAGPARLSSSVCGRGTFTDCLGVLSSRFARFAGIDWGSVGVAFFASILLLVAAGAFAGDAQRRLLFAWLSLAFLLALPETLGLIAVQVYPLRRFCPLCMTIHAIVLASAGLGAAYLAGGGWPARPATLLPWAFGHLAAFLAAFGLFVAYLAYDLEAKVHRVRLGWIGSTPLGALAEMAGRPVAASDVPDAAIRIGPPTAPIRLDALVHPMCSGCGPVVLKLKALAAKHAGIVTIGFHLPPRDAVRAADRELCAALSSVGPLVSGDEAVATFLRVKENPWSLLNDAEAGAEAALARILPGVAARGEALALARRAVAAADELAERLERGTPTLLVEGRLWDGSVEDFDRILSEHPDLLASLLGLPAGFRSASGRSLA